MGSCEKCGKLGHYGSQWGIVSISEKLWTVGDCEYCGGVVISVGVSVGNGKSGEVLKVGNYEYQWEHMSISGEV